ncbi:MAG: hypothetical protein C4328_04915 [Meiothermus sp.]
MLGVMLVAASAGKPSSGAAGTLKLTPLALGASPVLKLRATPVEAVAMALSTTRIPLRLGVT